MFRYDPVADLWTQKTSAPISRYSNGLNSFLGFSTLLDNKILVYYEHYNHQEYSSKFMVYNPKTDKWSDDNTPSFMAESSNSSDPFRGKGFTGVTSGVYAPQRVYVFSGNIYGSASNDVLVYDLVDDVWLTAKGMSINRTLFGVAVVDDVFT
ncbi:MAG: kelch repeat-containing protein [Candidatus Bathyarchaeota archaeon]|nr:kelch repeat-containing protein [Candidatus Termiticorpusculum sp.]